MSQEGIGLLMFAVAVFHRTISLLLAVAVGLTPMMPGADCCCVAKAQQRKACCRTKQQEESPASKECCRRGAPAESGQPCEEPAELAAEKHDCRCVIASNDWAPDVVRPRLKVNSDFERVAGTHDRSVVRPPAHFCVGNVNAGLRTDHRPLQPVLCVWIV